MYESFYGGKQGRSYAIVARYNSIYDMFLAFSGGDNYTDVSYDEYVIIDTILEKNEKNNPENGIIYRRGYNYNDAFYYSSENNEVSYTTLEKDRLININLKGAALGVSYNWVWDNDKNSVNNGSTYTTSDVIAVPEFYDFKYTLSEDGTGNIVATITKGTLNEKWNSAWEEFVTNPGGGAIYIGQIVGPEGGVPEIHMISWDEYQQAAAAAETEEVKNTFAIQPVPGYDPTHTGTINPNTGLDEDGYDVNHFHDKIQYAYCVIRDSRGNITGSYLSFDFPYTVFTFDASSISPYDSRGVFNPDTQQWSYNSLIEEQPDSQNHPFYKHYHIDVPSGIHGEDVNDFTIQSYAGGLGQDVYDEDGNYLDVAISSETDSRGNPFLNANYSNQYVTYTIKDYNATEEGEIQERQAIAPYKVIANLDTRSRLTPESGISNPDYQHSFPNQVTWNFTHGDSITVEHPVIERIWQQHGNTTDPVYGGGTLKDSHLYVLFSTERRPRDLGLVKYITSIWTQENTDNTKVDSNGNVLTANCVYIQLTGEDTPRYLGLIKRVDNIWTQLADDTQTVDADGNALLADYTYVQLTNEAHPRNLGYITKITEVSRNNEDKQFYTHFNYLEQNGEIVRGATTVLPVAEIADVKLNGDLVLVGYRNLDPEDLADFPEQLITQENGLTYINLGAVVKGNHILTNFNTYAELYEQYPYGLDRDQQGQPVVEEENRAGWLVTVGHDIDIVIDTTTGKKVANEDAIIENDAIVLPAESQYSDTTNLAIEAAIGYKIYGFDYVANQWYSVQDLAATAVKPEYSVLLAHPLSNNINKPDSSDVDQLNEKGLWFVITA